MSGYSGAAIRWFFKINLRFDQGCDPGRGDGDFL